MTTAGRGRAPMPAKGVYYNDTDKFCADWLRGLIRAGLLPDGDIDTRPIQQVQPEEVARYGQAHFFAGLGGWPFALRRAGWPDERPIWTGSAPCQPFSVAGKGLGAEDPRHLWPDLFRLVRACRPTVVMGEQVAGAAGYAWFDGVAADLEAEDYDCRAVDIPAAAVNSPQIRQRLYWVGDTFDAERWKKPQRRANLADRAPAGWLEGAGDAGASGQSAWSDWAFVGPDERGHRRRVKPGLPLLVARLPGDIPKLRAIANALVAPLAVEVIKAYMEAYEDR